MLTRVLLILFVSFSFVAGCGPSKSGDETSKKGEKQANPHDVPVSDAELKKLREATSNWAAAVEHIQKYSDTIKTETTGGTPEKAHHALDLVDKVLQWLPEIAQSDKVPKDNWQSVGENSQLLRDAFDEIHVKIDEGKAPDYTSVAAKIDAAIKALTAIRPGK